MGQANFTITVQPMSPDMAKVTALAQYPAKNA
jgi:hypothetical protein